MLFLTSPGHVAWSLGGGWNYSMLSILIWLFCASQFVVIFCIIDAIVDDHMCSGRTLVRSSCATHMNTKYGTNYLKFSGQSLLILYSGSSQLWKIALQSFLSNVSASKAACVCVLDSIPSATAFKPNFTDNWPKYRKLLWVFLCFGKIALPASSTSMAPAFHYFVQS